MNRQLGLVAVKAQPLVMATAKRYALDVWHSFGAVSFANRVVRVRLAYLFEAERYTQQGSFFTSPLYHLSKYPAGDASCVTRFLDLALIGLRGFFDQLAGVLNPVRFMLIPRICAIRGHSVEPRF